MKLYFKNKEGLNALEISVTQDELLKSVNEQKILKQNIEVATQTKILSPVLAVIK